MNVVVVGGGTAGWMAALMARKHLPSASITVIASEEIGILGAGEGTTPHFLDFLNDVGIPLKVITEKCKATLKVGIHFDNWCGDDSSYTHPFSMSDELNVHEYMDGAVFNTLMKQGSSVEDTCYVHNMAKQKLTPFLVTSNPNADASQNFMSVLTSTASYGVHFDARLLANTLKEISISRGVKHIDDKVTTINADEVGNIKSINITGQELPTDFLFDCTGFARKFIGGFFKSEWDSYASYLPMKAAAPFFIPHDDDVEPVTLARAMKFGWMWRIPVQGRFGCGYVYDTDYINAEQAIQEVEEMLGHEVDSPRTFQFSAGSYSTPLIKNCLAVGLSQGFVEPLEATSLMISYVCLRDFFNSKYALHKNQGVANDLNKLYFRRNKDVAYFLHLHYLTDRSDSKFWIEFKEKNKTPSEVHDLIGCTEANFHYPFGDKTNIFATHSWRVVHEGNGHKFSLPEEWLVDEKIIYSFRDNQRRILSNLVTNKDWLERMRTV